MLGGLKVLGFEVLWFVSCVCQGWGMVQIAWGVFHMCPSLALVTARVFLSPLCHQHDALPLLSITHILQVVVICGRNKKLLSQLRRTVWPGGSHVVPCGFVDNIHEV